MKKDFNQKKIVTYEEQTKLNYTSSILQEHGKIMKTVWNLVSETGEIKLLYNAKEVNIVTDKYAELEILLDEEPLPEEYSGF